VGVLTASKVGVPVTFKVGVLVTSKVGVLVTSKVGVLVASKVRGWVGDEGGEKPQATSRTPAARRLRRPV